MRVTDLMVGRNFLHNMRYAETRLLRLLDKASSGMEFTRPQDDPVGVTRSVNLRHHLAQNSQYLRNIDKANGWMEATEQALHELTSAVSRGQELALYAASDTMPEAARDAIKQEIMQIREEVQTVAARTFEDRTILTGTLPKWQVGPETMMSVEVLDDLLQAIDTAFEMFVEAEDGAGIMAAREGLNEALDLVVAERAKNGARMSRLRMLEEKITSLDVEYKRLLSNTEEADLSEVLVHLCSAEASYRSALATGARLIQPSLLDFLR